MKNTIKITIPFSFKGVAHTPSSIIDLDTFVLGDQTVDSLFHLVANENKIDNYSYEYEVLESSPKIFSEPTGIAGNFLSGNNFNLADFKQHCLKSDALDQLTIIAKKTMNIENLNDHKELKQALQQAYEAGENNPRKR